MGTGLAGRDGPPQTLPGGPPHASPWTHGRHRRTAQPGIGRAVLASTPPTNDTHATRTSIPSIPYNDFVDTTAATTDVNDAEVGSVCGSPPNGREWLV